MIQITDDDAKILLDAVLAAGLPMVGALLGIIGWFVRSKSREVDASMERLREEVDELARSLTNDYIRISTHSESRRELLSMIRENRLDMEAQLDRNLATTTRLYLRSASRHRRADEDTEGGSN